MSHNPSHAAPEYVTLPPAIRQLQRICRDHDPDQLHAFLSSIKAHLELRTLISMLCRRYDDCEADSDAISAYSLLIVDENIQNQREIQRFLHHQLAAVYRRAGDFARAKVHQQQAGRTPFTASDQGLSQASMLSKADLLSAWGQDALLERNFTLARQYISQALYWEELEKNLPGQAADWGNLGVLEGMAGRFVEGIRFLWKAFYQHHRIGDKASQVKDLMNLATLYENVGRTKFSLALLRRCGGIMNVEQSPQTSARLRALTRRMRQLELLKSSQACWN